MNILSNIDVLWLSRRVWSDRRRLIRNCFIGAIVALIIAFSIPRRYTSDVVLAPEAAKSSSFGALGSLASMAGVNVGDMTGGNDAIYPELYPQIVGSTVFIADLYAMNVKSGDGEIDMTLFDYIRSHQSKAWWMYIVELPLKLKQMLTSKAGGVSLPEDVTYYSYSEGETNVINKLRKLVLCSVDVGNKVVTISVTMQDAKIAAQVADRVASLLQDYVTKYRTGKTIKDFEYSNALYEEAKADYDKKQKAYALYADRHALGSITYSAKIEENRLRDEMELAYSIYTQMAQQKELAKAKVQERTPVFSVMQPAVVPRLPSAPKRMFMLISIVFLTFFGHVAWLMVEKQVKETIKQQRIAIKEEAQEKRGK